MESRIGSNDPRSVETPLRPILDQILAYPTAVAPDSAPEIQALIKKHSLRFELDVQTADFRFEANSGGIASARITVGLGALERTWAAAFAYTVLFSLYTDRHKARRSGRHVDSLSHPHLENALTLINWAFFVQHRRQRLPWPDNAPSPSKPSNDHKQMRSTEIAFTGMVGWLLLHELGHFACGHCDQHSQVVHEDSKTAHRNEYDADQWAHRQVTRTKRDETRISATCAVPFALGVVAAVDYRPTDQHPAVADRIRSYMREFISPLGQTERDLCATVHASAIVPLQAVLLQNGKLEKSTREFRDFEDYLLWWEKTLDG